MVFSRQTGIREHQWSGVVWASWGDALAEAGFSRNVLQTRFDTDDVLSRVAETCFLYGRIPTVAELKLCRTTDPTFPSNGAIANHFPTRASLITALADYVGRVPSLSKIAPLVSEATQAAALYMPYVSPSEAIEDGIVYLLKSGSYFKIGQSNAIERRVREIRVALPEAVSLLHAIQTDDPPGIEAYWHRRFANKRANGEWFKLSTADVAAFKRRRFQ